MIFFVVNKKMFKEMYLLIFPEAVVLEEFTSKNLRHTLDKLMTDCDRRQSMVQELISSSHRIQLVLFAFHCHSKLAQVHIQLYKHTVYSSPSL